MPRLSRSNDSLKSKEVLNFGTPPVVETAISAQLSGVNWSVVRFGQYYDLIKDRFPTFKPHHEVPPMVETFPLVTAAPSINFSDRPTVGRGIFEAEDESHLIQIQDNRFGFNWKRATGDSEYPHFDANLKKFDAEFLQYKSFCSDADIGTPVPTFCEVVYVNQIAPKEGESVANLFDSIFEGVAVSGDINTELMTLNRTYELGKKEGRLYAEAGIVLVPSPIVVFKLTSRLRVNDGLLTDGLRRAHDLLIEKFLALTTKKCRMERWEQR